MATTLTSSIINVNVSKLKKDLEALGDIRVRSISPKNGPTDTTVVMVRGDGVSNLTGGQTATTQALIDAHVDLQDEDLKLLGRNETILGNVQVGTIDFYNTNVSRWRINTFHAFLPVANASYDLGSSGLRINQLFSVSGNFSGDVSIAGNLTVSGTTTTINTANLDIADNIITLNADWVGAPTEDAGILIERGSSTDAQLLWNETTDKFQAGTLSDLQNLIRQTEFDTHANSVSNPHVVTKAQVGLNSVTDDAQLKRVAGDFVSFAAKATPVSADVFLIEDSAAAGVKKYVTLGQIASNFSHLDLTNIGTNTHAQIDTHIANTVNPHAVTKTQVGLVNVTNDAQLKRDANDFNAFTLKAAPTASDLILIEDDADSGVKKYVTIGTLPFLGSGDLDGFPLPGTPTDGQTLVFNNTLSQWDYTELGIALKVPTGLGNIPFDAADSPLDGEYPQYDAGSNTIIWTAAPGVSSSGPVGSIICHAASAAPISYLECDGAAVSRTFYADLFAVIGTLYGVGDNSTTFNLPDTRQRFLLGLAVSGTGSTLGGTGGAIDHTHTISTTATGQTGGVELLPTTTSTGVSNPPFIAVKHFIKYADNVLATGTTSISNDIAFNGIVTLKSHSAYTNSHKTERTFGFQTTDISQQTALSIALPDLTVTWIEVLITARFQNTGVNKSYAARIFGGVRRNNAGVAVLIDTPEIADLIAENAANYSVDLGVTGNDVTVLVTGAASETVNWTGTVRYQSASLAT